MKLAIIKAILKNILKDTRKNRRSVIMYLLMPVLAYLMKCVYQSNYDRQTITQIILMFAVMHSTLIPVISTSTLCAQEKESNTLRSLFLNGVVPAEFMVSVTIFGIIATTFTGSLFAVFCFNSALVVPIILTILFTAAISSMIGLCIGVSSDNVSGANSIAILVALPLALIPSLSTVSGFLAKIASLLYNTQLSNLMYQRRFGIQNVLIVLLNLAIVLLAFAVTCKKNKYEG